MFTDLILFVKYCFLTGNAAVKQMHSRCKTDTQTLSFLKVTSSGENKNLKKKGILYTMLIGDKYYQGINQQGRKPNRQYRSKVLYNFEVLCMKVTSKWVVLESNIEGGKGESQ